MIDLKTQHRIDGLNREIDRLRHYEKKYNLMKPENKDLKADLVHVIRSLRKELIKTPAKFSSITSELRTYP